MLPFAAKIRDDTHFEELCYEVLKQSGFSNLRWRGPAADGGRDIEADWYFVDAVGFSVREPWFIECKFYTDSVPFGEIEPKLQAADAEDQRCLLVITSSTVRNTCLDRVDRWLENRGNPLRFRYWNGHDLSRRIVALPDVLEQYFPEYQSGLNEQLQQIATRQELLITGVQERLERHLGGLVQSANGLLGSMLDPCKTIKTASRRLQIVAHMLAALKCLSANEDIAPSSDPFKLDELLQVLVDEFTSRGWHIGVDCPSGLNVNTSYSILFAALYELVDNAVRYSQGDVQITCFENAGRWRLDITNECDHDVDLAALNFPRPRLRSKEARAIHPGGSGLGCWISKSLLRRVETALEWEFDTPKWKTSIVGVVGGS